MAGLTIPNKPAAQPAIACTNLFDFMTIQDCAESITTRLFSVNWMGNHEAMGDRIAIKSKEHDGEKDLGGYCYDAAKKAVESELRAWLQGMDDPESNK